jgi:hypothetical protein
MNRLYRLLAYGYFPKELPPIFSTGAFARETYKLSDIDLYAGKRWQRSCPYLLQQKALYRRKLDILCPNAFLKQAGLIAQNYDQLKDKFPPLPGNCSRPAFNRKTKFQRAVRPFAIGRGYTQRKLELRSRFPTILKLDVKNYYRSVYTHSIPWAIHGKTYAKTHIRDDNLGNSLDRALQHGQDGQTIGIPTGPDTSFIISEVILCRIIDEMIADHLIKYDRFVRYYDDIEYGCDSEEEAHRILSHFEDELRGFELEVNPDKVHMFSGPQDIGSPWLYRLREIEWRDGITSDLLMEMFSFIAELAQTYPHDHVFRYFLRKMRNAIVAEEAWYSYQRILLSLFQENRGNAKEVFDQFSFYQSIGWRIDRKALKEALDRKVQQQLARGSTSELSWALYGYILFAVNLDKDLARRVLQKGDVPSKVLVTKLIFDRKMPLKSDVNAIARSWSEDVLNSSEWLLAYEVLLNRWHSRFVPVQFPQNKELYELMKDTNVSFLDYLSLEHIDLPPAFRRYARSSEGPEEEDLDFTDFLAEDEVEGHSSEQDDDEIETAYFS